MADQEKSTEQESRRAQASRLTLEICALDRAPLHFEANEVAIPGTEGLFVVLPGHAPLLSMVELGVIQTTLTSGEQRSFAVNGGFAQVFEDRVLILSKTAEADTEIDVERAKAAQERAKKRIDHPSDNIDVHRAEVALRRAMVRLQAAGKAAGQS